jgi:energy-coupling factor transporter transmembrane protein EcfT
LERCLALATVLLFFSLLIHTTPPVQLQGALYWLLRPLRRLGLPADQLSIRIALTLQKIHELQSHWLSDSGLTRKLNSWRDIPERIAALIHEVFTQAEAKPLQIELSLETSAPGHWQWFVLIILVTIIVAARIFTTHFL